MAKTNDKTKKSQNTDETVNAASVLSSIGNAAGNVGINYFEQAVTNDNNNNPSITNAVSGSGVMDLFNSYDRLKTARESINNNMVDLSNAYSTDYILNNWGTDSLQNTIDYDTTDNTIMVGSNIAKGAATGAALGNIIPGIGTVVGAIAGGVTGLVSGAANAFENKRNTNALNKSIINANKDSIANLNNAITKVNTINARKNRMNIFEQGGDMTSFNVGGSHEQNPFGGIPQGIGANGKPNLVEEGEVKYKFIDGEHEEYIFPVRTKMSESMLTKYNLPTKYKGKTMADVAKALQKTYEEQKNDPIAKSTANTMLRRLQAANEELIAKKQEREVIKAFNALPMEEQYTLLSQIDGQQMPQQEMEGNMFEDGGFKSEYYNPYIEVEGEDGSTQYTPEELGTKLMPISNGYTLEKFFGKKWHKNDAIQAINYYPDEYLDPKYWKYIKNPFRITFSPAHLGIFPAVGSGPTRSPKVVDITTDSPEYKRSQATVAFNKGEIDANEYAKRLKLINDGIAIDNEQPSSSVVYSDLRYAPAIGAGIGALTAILQSPDYSYAENLERIAAGYKPISTPRMGGFQQYTPYDINLQNNNTIATREAMLRDNRANTNRANQVAGMIAINNALANQEGIDFLNWQKDNAENKAKVDAFNADINKINMSLAQQEAAQNAAINDKKLQMLEKAATARDASDTARATNISATSTNFFNNLGNVGKDRDSFMLSALGILTNWENMTPEMQELWKPYIESMING